MAIIKHFQNDKVIVNGGVQTAIFFMLAVIVVLFFALVVLIPRFFSITLDNTMYFLMAIGALLITGIVYWYKKQGHQGNQPMFIGIALMGLASIPLVSSISIF